MKPKRIMIVALAGLLVALPAFLTGCPGGIVFFPDENLELAVRYELGQPLGFVSTDDMERITTLTAANSGISDLRGLEFATNLQNLYLANDAPTSDGIINLDPVAGLTNLLVLDLRNNRVTNVAPLSGLFNLDQLFLAGNDVFNVGPLRANSGAGGLGPGDTLTLEASALFDDAGRTGAQVEEDLRFMLGQGVDILFFFGDSAMVLGDDGTLQPADDSANAG